MVAIPEDDQRLRKQLWRVIHEGQGRKGHLFNFVLMVLILLSLAILPLEFFEQFRRYHTEFIVIEGVITGIFTVEYLLRVYAAPSRWRYIFSFFGVVDLIAILPFYIGLFGSQSLRALRLIRLLRIGHIDAAAEAGSAQSMGKWIGLVEDEQVEYVVVHHPIFLLLGSIPPLIAATVSLGIGLVFDPTPITLGIIVLILLFAVVLLWKAWLDYSYDVIYITSHRLLFHNQHLFGRSVNQVNFFAITNVKPAYTGVFSYIFGYGSITIETAAEHFGHFGLDMIKHHEQAAHIIMQKCFAARPGNA